MNKNIYITKVVIGFPSHKSQILLGVWKK